MRKVTLEIVSSRKLDNLIFGHRLSFISGINVCKVKRRLPRSSVTTGLQYQLSRGKVSIFGFKPVIYYVSG